MRDARATAFPSRMKFLGRARASSANASPARTFGVSPKQSFPAKVRDREDAIANTRDACATRNRFHRQAADECRLAACAPQSRLKTAHPFRADPRRLHVAHGNRFYILVRALQQSRQHATRSQFNKEIATAP